MLDIDPDMESVPSGIRRHALDYLKGKDPVNPGMWTRDFWGEEFVEELTAEELTAEDKNMTMQELEPEPQKTELEQIAQAFLLMKLPVTIVKV